MNDLVEQTATTEQVAGDTPKRKAGRPRKIKAEQVVDPEKKQMMQQIESLMAQVQILTKSIAEAQTRPTAGSEFNMFLPPPPEQVARPEGVEYELTRKEEKMDETEIARKSIFIRTLPPRPDNPNEADPRYCVFCSYQTLDKTLEKPKPNSFREPNIAKLYGATEISATPTPEELNELRKLHREHIREMENWGTSDKIGGVRRSVGNMHLHLEAKKRGRVKDEVAFQCSGMRNGENISISSAEENEKRKQDYEAELRALARSTMR